MNEFAMASGRTVVLEGVTLRQVAMHQFDQFVQHAHVVREWLRENGADKAVEAFIQYGAATLELLKLLSDIDDSKLAQARNNPELFLSLIIGMYQLNGAYFDEAANTEQADPDSKRTWFDNFQFLIDHGHQNDQIMQYTYGAFIGYIEAAKRSSGFKRYFTAEAMRVAQHADADGFEEYASNLTESE